MKKQLLTIALGTFLSLAASAQNYSIIDSLGNDLSGTTVSYNVANNALDSKIFTVNNLTGNTVTVKVKKTTVYLNDPGSTVYFCTGTNCYSPTQTLSLNVTMNGGGNVVLTCDHFPNNTAGITQVRYTVINQSNANDTASFTINYNALPTGIATHTLVKSSISNPAPNPASAMFSVNYNMGSANPKGAKMVVYNLLGDRVMESAVEEMEGVVKMDVSSLDQGVYFCSLESDGKILSTRRLVVTH
ncbi:hypothetical protein BH11BAC7_BH11BAC7_21720 [soil metagenome]